MSENSFTEVTNESWFGRIGGAIKGVLVGLVLILIAFILLFWNEGRSVERYKTLKEGSSAVVSIKSDTVNPFNDGKLVHVTGKADTEDTLTDSIFFTVSVKALKLERVVKMYQWKESSRSTSKKKLGGGKKTVTTYTYSKGWFGKAIDSSRFKKQAGHENPGSMPYKSAVLFADHVTLGAFDLPRHLVEKIGGAEAFPVSKELLPSDFRATGGAANGEFYFGDSPANPKIGDTRVAFKVIKPVEVSILSGQMGNTFEPYETESGGEIDILENGIHSAKSMFRHAQNSNKMLTWILRFAGFILMLIGFMLIFSPLSVVADVVPLFGSIVGAGTGIIAFLLSLILSFLVIGFAWMFYRPLIGVPLLLVAVALLVLTRGKLKSARA